MRIIYDVSHGFLYIVTNWEDGGSYIGNKLKLIFQCPNCKGRKVDGKEF